MSLQLAAQHLAAKGRGPDTTLVHMSPGEVASLQSLARANGGTLTVNPDTGLPEAGFLSAILPIVAGAALGPAGLGLTAMQAGLAAGAVGTLATGSLRKGLMAGLGAYGGAGLMGSVTGAGNAAASGMASAEAAAAGEAAARQALVPSGIPAAPVAPVATPAAAVPAEYAGFGPTATQYGAFGEAPLGVAPAPVAPVATATPAPSLETAVVRAPGTAPTYEQMRAAGFSDADIAQNAREHAANLKGTAQDPFSQATRDAMASPAKTGLSAVMKDPKQLFTKANMQYGLAALAPLMLQEQKNEAPAGSGPNPYQYAYNPGRVANPQRTGGVGEYEYFRPSYTRLAAGGPVEAMSDRNMQETFVTNGGRFFAEGGATDVPKYVYDPVTQTYKDTTNVQPVQTVTRMPGAPGAYDSSMGGAEPNNPGWSQLTPSQQAAFYAANPTFSAVTQFGQGLFGLTALGQLQNALVPNFVQQQQMIAKGIDPNGMAGLSPQQQANVNAALSGYLESSMNQAGPAVTGGYDAGGFGAYGENVAPGGGGVEVGGPISSGDVTGVDIGSIGGASIGDAVAGISAADVSAAADAAAAADGGGGGGGGDGADYARGGLSAAYARGGYHLGDYSDGGRLLRGPGDGVSDSIPATIAGKRPARLADGEFVVPARIVSELGNGSTEAGARKLYAMMDRIQKARRKSVGKGKVAVNSRADKLLPA
jgi:hypothetical protein